MFEMEKDTAALLLYLNARLLRSVTDNVFHVIVTLVPAVSAFCFSKRAAFITIVVG